MPKYFRKYIFLKYRNKLKYSEMENKALCSHSLFSPFFQSIIQKSKNNTRKPCVIFKSQK